MLPNPDLQTLPAQSRTMSEAVACASSQPSQICSPDRGDTMMISVIIPAFNEENVIEQCLTCLARQDFPADQFEVIVVDNASTDRTRGIAHSFSRLLNLTVLTKAGGHISSLRNMGAAAAKGQFLAFLDADCFAVEQWLSRAAGRLQASDGGVVGAFYTIPSESSWVAKTWYEDLPWLKKGKVSYVPSGNLFISRAVFLKVQGFDPALQTCEDFEFCQRVAAAGYSVRGYAELSTVHAGTPQTLFGFYRKQRWHGNGVRTAFFQGPLQKNILKTIAHAAFTLFLLLASVLACPVALATGQWLWITIAPGALLLSSFALALRGTRLRRRYSLLLPLTVMYLTYGIARALSFLGINGRRKSTRQRPSVSMPSCAEDARV